MARRRKHKVRSQTRIVAAMASVMLRDFEDGAAPSKFTHEGPFIALMRSELCLIGWDWPMADRAARDVVDAALQKARAARPSWAEGQRAYVQTDVTRDAECRQCGVGLKARQVSFCSGSCRSRWWRLFNAEAA